MSGDFSRGVINLAGSLRSRAAEGAPGGLISGIDPTEFQLGDPIRLWIIQIGIIISFSQLLGMILRRLREPKVIAEVVGGIMLGPTLFGMIPGFTKHIFPDESISYLSLTANIGLVLFLFLVGLEIETSVIKKNARFAFPVALGGMVLPFGLGAAMAVPLWKNYIDSSVPYTHFMVFTGVAFSITAFPVLCRILTELDLINSTVGIVVLSAGVGNDIIGWVLLALAVALVSGGAGLNALWILLTAVAFTLFLFFLVKPAMLWIARRTGSIENGPTMTFMTVTILMTFASAFFTDAIGVNAIFGGFLAGLIVPREGGLAITLTEKLEDMVQIIFLPLYFTLSGLSTNLRLLNDGKAWGFTFAIVFLALFGKFFGCSVTAKAFGFSYRESATVGALMSCKGLVELIVLNVGLNAGILTQKVFSMFVFEALVLTCLTTPMVLLLYPEHKRSRSSGTGPDYQKPSDEAEGGQRKRRTSQDGDDPWKTRFTVVIDKLEHLPGMMTLTQLVHPPTLLEKESSEDLKQMATRTSGSGSETAADSPAVIDALRLIELSDRTSAVLRANVADQLINTDPLLNVFRVFADLNDLSVSSSLSIVTFNDLASRVAARARDNDSQLVLIPWLPPSVAMHTRSTDGGNPQTPGAGGGPGTMTSAVLNQLSNPFDSFFRTHSLDKSASIVHSQFVRSVFAQCSTDVALYIDRTYSDSNEGHLIPKHGMDKHILLPFFGGPDDRLALEFVVQLCANPRISATIIRMSKSDTAYEDTARLPLVTSPDATHTHQPRSGESAEPQEGDDTTAAAANIRANSYTWGSASGEPGSGMGGHWTTSGHPDTVYGHPSTQVRLQSETADNILWSRYANPSPDENHPKKVTDALLRVTFEERHSPEPLHAIIDEVAGRAGRTSTQQVPNSSRPGIGSRSGSSAVLEKTRLRSGMSTIDEADPDDTGAGPKRGTNTLVVLGRSRRMAVEDHHKELKKLIEAYGHVGGEVRKTIGDVATALVASGCNVGLIVLQASNRADA